MKKTVRIVLFSMIYAALIIVPIIAIITAPAPSAQELIYSRYYDWSFGKDDVFIYENASYKAEDPHGFYSTAGSFKHVSESANYYFDAEHVISKTPSSNGYYLLVSAADQDVIMLIPKKTGLSSARPFGFCLVKQGGDEE